MYNMGFFNPQLAEQSMTALELMDFDGIETVKEKVQQGQTLMNMVNQLAQELAVLKNAMGIATPEGMAMPATPNIQMGGGMGQAQKQAQKETMTSYGERLAQRATPDMNNG
jgi:hypothetical protein